MASAVVQMTAFSPCSQLGDMIMIGMEASLESFPGSREDGNKRTHSDGDEDQDRSYVKKRRKQSKPIRITAHDSASENKTDMAANNRGVSTLDFAETGEHFLSEGLAGISTGSVSTAEDYSNLNRLNEEPKTTFDSSRDKNIQSEKIYDSVLPLNLSSIKPSGSDSLIVPNVSESQTTSNIKVPIEKEMSQPFQPASHESVKTSIAQEGSYLPQSPSLLLPLLKQNQIPGQISQLSSQMRIFNPEAFCDLCNKEFCNKYFLKTHKANKHGIYTENISGPTLIDPLLSLPFTNYFSTSNETFESPPTFQTAKTLFNQNSYSTNRAIVKKSQGTQQQQTSLFSLKSTSSGNMRALCNICQREFCNKYFVRRHKLKIHGIIDPISKDGSTSDTQENNSVNNNSSQDKPDFPISDTEIYSVYGKQLTASELTQKIEINTEKSKDKHEKEPKGELQLSVSIPTSSDSASFFHAPQNEENNKENTLSSIRLKKLGVVNADAFCDICCKEYCNKYFLRTHKLKSHGIPPVEEKKDDTVNGTTGNISWYQNQATPLNLIVNESSTNKDSTNKICFDLEGDECICGICGRYFQNQFLLKMHQAYTHPNKFTFNEDVVTGTQNVQSAQSLDKDVNEGDQSQKQPTENYTSVIKSEYLKDADESENKVIVDSENLQKLQSLILRLNNPNIGNGSLCDVCDKDVGHFSLLENHILKEHALLLEEMGNITEEENSSSQGSLVGSIYNFKKECPHCQKSFFKTSILDQHIHEVHRDLDTHPDSQTAKGPMEFKESNSSIKLSPVPFAVQSLDERPGLQTPTSSFCEICKKELCNKYFMKTHMQRMHGISIENGSQIGGVVCDICNKELCSKYFLRVHKQNSHGIVDELFLPQLGIDFISNQSPNSDPALKPTDQADLTHRYFTHFTEVCTICSRRFRSVKWLKAHLWNDHGEEGKEKWKEVFLPSSCDPKTNQFEDMGKSIDLPVIFGNTSDQSGNMLCVNENNQNEKDTSGFVDKNILNNTMFSMIMNGKDSESKHYQCSYCSFTTTILAFLFIHERTHVNNQSLQSESDEQFQCPICYQNTNSKEHFDKHMQLHKMTWQQPFSSTASSHDVPQVSGEQCEKKTGFAVPKERNTRQHEETNETSNVQFHQDSKPVTTVPNREVEQTTDSSLHCPRCRYKTSSVQMYLDHTNKDHPFHQMDQDLPSYLQLVEKVLSNLASNTGIPAVVALPQVQEQVTMQPFVLEDSEYVSDTNNSIDPKSGKTFLSSLVFLPVKEKLKKSVTASFKLTPT